ncbi:MAG: hypothetical protein KME30_29090 [Iphinoe sp. HA4291-MV1]|nr:hypothetical protein [Iphinoe sp. HA4291-MV1]
MNTQIVVFEGLDFPILEADNYTWFRATEACKILGFSNPYETVKLHCKEHQYREWQVGKGRPSLYVLESGLYRLILRSKKPEAIAFQDWVTEDVLPSIRKTGLYVDKSKYTDEQYESLHKQAEAYRKENEQLKLQENIFREITGLGSQEDIASYLPSKERCTTAEILTRFDVLLKVKFADKHPQRTAKEWLVHFEYLENAERPTPTKSAIKSGKFDLKTNTWCPNFIGELEYDMHNA